MTVAIVGGSGDFGQGLAARLRAGGEEVVIGSRRPRGGFVSNEAACRLADVVFVAVPPEAAEATARGLAAELAGKVAVSVAAFLDPRPGPSLAELTARAAPEARIVAAFHTVSAKLLAAAAPLEEDVLLCGDDQQAKERVGALAAHVVAGQAVDCGPLAAARRLEALTGLLVAVNRRYRTNAGVRITGL